MLEVCCFADVQRMLRMLASVSSVEIGLRGLKMFSFPHYEGHSLFALRLYLKHGGIVLRSVLCTAPTPECLTGDLTHVRARRLRFGCQAGGEKCSD